MLDRSLPPSSARGGQPRAEQSSRPKPGLHPRVYGSLPAHVGKDRVRPTWAAFPGRSHATSKFSCGLQNRRSRRPSQGPCAQGRKRPRPALQSRTPRDGRGVESRALPGRPAERNLALREGNTPEQASRSSVKPQLEEAGGTECHTSVGRPEDRFVLGGPAGGGRVPFLGDSLCAFTYRTGICHPPSRLQGLRLGGVGRGAWGKHASTCYSAPWALSSGNFIRWALGRGGKTDSSRRSSWGKSLSEDVGPVRTAPLQLWKPLGVGTIVTPTGGRWLGGHVGDSPTCTDLVFGSGSQRVPGTHVWPHQAPTSSPRSQQACWERRGRGCPRHDGGMGEARAGARMLTLGPVDSCLLCLFLGGVENQPVFL